MEHSKPRCTSRWDTLYKYCFFPLQSLTDEFEIPEEDMAVLDNIRNDPELKMVTAERMRKAINSDKPDGYKLKLHHCVYPAMFMTRDSRNP